MGIRVGWKVKKEETTMHFDNPRPPLSETDLQHCESLCGLRFPPALRRSYFIANGGSPNPYIFQDDRNEAVVQEFLPLLASPEMSALQCYEHLVRDLKMVPPNFFPFAIDPGGDFFFVDTSTADGRVHLFRHDTTDEPLISFDMGIAQFWESLVPEE